MASWHKHFCNISRLVTNNVGHHDGTSYLWHLFRYVRAQTLGKPLLLLLDDHDLLVLGLGLDQSCHLHLSKVNHKWLTESIKTTSLIRTFMNMYDCTMYMYFNENTMNVNSFQYNCLLISFRKIKY